MRVPYRKQIAVGKYLFKEKLKRNERYPLVLILYPLPDGRAGAARPP